jgi:hypothetical protein
MPTFVPSQQQRAFVAAATGTLMGWGQMAALVINPRTSKAISKETLQRAFAPELKLGNARLKAMVASKFYERLLAGDLWAVKFGLRHICGFGRDEATVSQEGEGGGIRVELIHPSDGLPRALASFVTPATVPTLTSAQRMGRSPADGRVAIKKSRRPALRVAGPHHQKEKKFSKRTVGFQDGSARLLRV